MRNSIKQTYVGREDFNREDKVSALNTQKLCSLLMIIVSITNAILAYVMEGKFHNSISVWIGIFSTLIFLLGISTLMWSLSKSSKMKENPDKWIDTTMSKVGRLTLCAGSILFFLLLIFTFYHNIAINETFNLAESKGIDAKDYKKYLFASNALSVLSLLLLAWTIYTAYIIAKSTHIVRFMIYLVSIIQVVFCTFVFLYSKIILSFGDKSNVSKLVFFWAVRLVIAMTAFILAAVIGLVVINFKRKWRMPYMIVGAIMLFLIIVLSSAGAQSVRNAKTVDKDLNKDCKSALDSIGKETLKSNGCKDKYIDSGNSPYLTCPANEQAVMWELDINKDLSAKQNKVGCLNMKCCGNVAEAYRKWLVRLGISVIALVAFTFLNICCCFFMSSKFAGQRGFPKAVELVFMALFVLAIIAMIIVLSIVNGDIKERSKVVIASAIQSNKADLSKIQYYPKSVDEIPQHCQSLEHLKAYKPSDTCKTHCKEQQVRTSILSKNSNFIVKNHWKQDKVKLFDEEAKYILFGNSAKNSKFAAFQGLEIYDQDFYDNKLKVCTVKQTDKPEISTPFNYLVPKPAAKKKTTTRLLEEKPEIKVPEVISEDQVNPLAKFDHTQFGNYHLKIVSLFDNQMVSGAKLNLYEDKANERLMCKEGVKAHSRLSLKTNSEGKATFNNLEYGFYTLFIEKEGFKVTCNQIQVTKDEWKERAFLIPEMKKGQEAYVISWKQNSISITSGAAFALNSMIECVTTNTKTKCGGMKYHSSKPDNEYQGNANVIFIEKLASYNYLFYIKEIIPLATYKSKIGLASGLNSDFMREHVQGYYYVHELKFPAEKMNGFNNKFKEAKIQTQVQKEKNLAYLVGCVNGHKTDKLKRIDQYWYKGSEYTKNDGQQIPPPTLCNILYKK